MTQLPVAEVDVTEVGRSDPTSSDPEIVLTAASGVKIKWGRSDIYEQVAELRACVPVYPDSGKLLKLKEMLRQYPQLDGIEYVDVRFNKVVFRSRPDTGDSADAIGATDHALSR